MTLYLLQAIMPLNWKQHHTLIYIISTLNTSCNTCGMQVGLYYLQQHYKRHHSLNAKTFNCDYCRKKSFTKRRLSDHENEIYAHQRIIPQDRLCVECGKTFVSVERLNEHKALMHKTDAMMHICKICKKSFKNERIYKAHTKRNHLTLPWSTCDKKFGSRQALNTQNKMKHANPAIDLPGFKYLDH